MSDPTPSPPPPPAAPPPRDGCLTAIMVVFGIILLLPGLCVMMLLSSVPGHIAYEEKILIGVCVVAALGGIALIVKAAR